MSCLFRNFFGSTSPVFKITNILSYQLSNNIGIRSHPARGFAVDFTFVRPLHYIGNRGTSSLIKRKFEDPFLSRAAQVGLAGTWFVGKGLSGVLN